MKKILSLLILLLLTTLLWAQKTQIRGFANVDVRYNSEDNLSFVLGEQDLFITREINDRINFLGESVFKYSSNSATNYNVSIERLIISYNYKGNHSIHIGKHHTPISYWNNTYHHGRVLFPTIDRPQMFQRGLVELHTTGIGFQGDNFGKYNIGYNVMVGNGIGSTSILDNNASKSLTACVNSKPLIGMEFGFMGYADKFTSHAKNHHADLHSHDTLKEYDMSQLTGGMFFKYFRGNYQVLTEAHVIRNDHDSIGATKNNSFYMYIGYIFKDKIVPYVKVDFVGIDRKELFFEGKDTRSYSLGLGYEFGYLAKVKLEYVRSLVHVSKVINGINVQFAVGF